MSHEVSVDPVDDACIDVCHLEQGWHLGVPGTAIHPNHICHLTAEARAHVNAWFRPYQRRAIDPTTPQILQSMFNKGMAHAMRAAITLHKIHVKWEASKVPLELMEISTRLVDAAFADTIRLHRGNAGAITCCGTSKPPRSRPSAT